MSDTLISALQISVLGMGLVFGAIVLLWGVLSIVVRLTAERTKAVEPAPLDEPRADEHILKQRAASVAVSIALASRARAGARTPTPPPTASVSPWQAVMRGRQLKQRGPMR